MMQRTGTSSKPGKLDLIPADVSCALQLTHLKVFVRCYHTLKLIGKDFAPRAPELVELNNLWLYGAPGSGKSVRARQLAPNAYPKAYNKWWDGYQGKSFLFLIHQ